MTKDEISLLLYLETCAVDYGGLVAAIHMNENDFKIINKWHSNGFIQYGRVAIEYIKSPHFRANWCRLSERAMISAAKYRKQRAEHMWKNRKWKTTEEKRNG